MFRIPKIEESLEYPNFPLCSAIEMKNKLRQTKSKKKRITGITKKRVKELEKPPETKKVKKFSFVKEVAKKIQSK